MEIEYYNYQMPEDVGRYDYDCIQYQGRCAVIKAHELSLPPVANLIAFLIDSNRPATYFYGDDDLLYYHRDEDKQLNQYIPLEACRHYINSYLSHGYMTEETCPTGWYYFQCYPSHVCAIIRKSYLDAFWMVVKNYQSKLENKEELGYHVREEFPLIIHEVLSAASQKQNK